MRHHDMSYKKFKLMKGIFILACAGVLGLIVMALWNWLLPEIFPGAHAVNYWQALGLLLLCRILFGGFRGHHRDWHEKREHWQRWQAMTPEERQAFFKNRANFCRPAAPTETKE
jgi:hypothetical protein